MAGFIRTLPNFFLTFLTFFLKMKLFFLTACQEYIIFVLAI